MALVVSIQADAFDELARRAVRAAPSADLVELRLDRLVEVGESDLARLIHTLERPVIVAVNGPDAYGTFQGNAAQRRAMLERAARAGASFIDIDWREARELTNLPARTRRIVSRHERASSRPARDLERELRDHSREGDWKKLVIEANDAHRALETLARLDASRADLIAFASGPAGSFTRILAPILGSPLTYAAADPEREAAPRATAPGQLTASQLRAAWPAAGPRASTRIFALLGNPIAHSISPRVHTRALREGAIDGVFVALAIDDLPQTVERCSGENWRGFAVTAPHKQAAFNAVAQHDAASLRARASNTLVRTGVGWSAFNTDVTGVRRALENASQGIPLAGHRALVLGAGGAARAALVALEQSGARCVVSARNHEQARELAVEFGASACEWEERAELARKEAQMILQCTSARGVEAESLLPEDAISKDALVLDAIYQRHDTPLIAAAKRRGARTATGAEWFLHQAELQFELLTGQPAADGVMREEVTNALA